MKRLVSALALAVASAAPLRAQVIFDNTGLANTASPRGASSPASPLGIGQEFTFTDAEVLSQFGFLIASSSGGTFNFFVADAANNVIHSSVQTVGVLGSPTLVMSNPFVLAIGAGSSFSFGLILQSPTDEYRASDIFPPNLASQNGVTPFGGNENWNNFASPTITSGGGVTFAMQLVAGTSTTATPEPASLVLVGTGLAGLVGVTRRRKRAA